MLLLVSLSCTGADVVALTQCARSSLGVCAAGSGYIAGLVVWKVSHTQQCFQSCSMLHLHRDIGLSTSDLFLKVHVCLHRLVLR